MAFIPLLSFIFPTAAALTTQDFETIGELTRLAYYGMVIVMVSLAPFARYHASVVTAIWRFAAAVNYTSWLAAIDISASRELSHFWVGFTPGFLPFPAFSPSPKRHINLGSTVLSSPLFLHNSLYLLLPLALSASLHVFSRLYRQRNSALWRYCFKYEVQLVALVLGYLLAFQDLLIFALVQGQNMRFSSSIEAINAVSGFIYIPLAVSVVLYLLYLFIKEKQSIRDGQAFNKSSILGLYVDGMKEKLPFFRYFAVQVFTVQRLVASLLYVLLKSYGKMQLYTLFTQEIIALGFCVTTRPFKSRANNTFYVLLQLIPCLLLLILTLTELDLGKRADKYLTITYISLYWCLYLTSACHFLLEFWVATRVLVPPSEVPEDWQKVTISSQSLGKNSACGLHIESQLPNDSYCQMANWAARRQLKEPAKVAPIAAFRGPEP